MARKGQRIIQYRFGDPQEVLEVESTTFDYKLAEGEVLVRVARSVIHPGDLQLIAAKGSNPSEKLPEGRLPGLEAAGVIEDAAQGALDGTGLMVGMRVAFFYPGAWQSYVTVPVQALVALPDDMSDEIATQVLINTITARQVLRAALGELESRPAWLIQTGASSSVAKMITYFALQLGIAPIRLVRSKQSGEHLERVLPGGIVISTDVDGWQAEVRKVAGDDIILAVDGVGGDMLAELCDLLAVKGRIVSYGALANGSSDMTAFSGKALTLAGVTIMTWQEDVTAEERMQDMKAAIEIGTHAKTMLSRYTEFDLSEIHHAVKAVSAPEKKGNILLKF
ncbi:alcohol dehydrogenase catalytic domain-containing protein [Paenibacillus sp. SAF-054]|uniref:alcohol dehydrogenase catalytic domain-containing protein n=1 Tax=unclassified Paenibacillus TaxID=185978 RepID=UPI003F80448B